MENLLKIVLSVGGVFLYFWGVMKFVKWASKKEPK